MEQKTLCQTKLLVRLRSRLVPAEVIETRLSAGLLGAWLRAATICETSGIGAASDEFNDLPGSFDDPPWCADDDAISDDPAWSATARGSSWFVDADDPPWCADDNAISDDTPWSATARGSSWFVDADDPPWCADDNAISDDTPWSATKQASFWFLDTFDDPPWCAFSDDGSWIKFGSNSTKLGISSGTFDGLEYLGLFWSCTSFSSASLLFFLNVRSHFEFMDIFLLEVFFSASSFCIFGLPRFFLLVIDFLTMFQCSWKFSSLLASMASFTSRNSDLSSGSKSSRTSSSHSFPTSDGNSSASFKMDDLISFWLNPIFCAIAFKISDKDIRLIRPRLAKSILSLKAISNVVQSLFSTFFINLSLASLSAIRFISVPMEDPSPQASTRSTDLSLEAIILKLQKCNRRGNWLLRLATWFQVFKFSASRFCSASARVEILKQRLSLSGNRSFSTSKSRCLKLYSSQSPTKASRWHPRPT